MGPVPLRLSSLAYIWQLGSDNLDGLGSKLSRATQQETGSAMGSASEDSTGVFADGVPGYATPRHRPPPGSHGGVRLVTIHLPAAKADA